MNILISFADNNFEAGRPNGTLNNWSVDVVFESMADRFENEAVFCLLNVEGLGNTMIAGEVKVEDIFKVMPFDNEIVAVKLPIEVLNEIADYISASGGEPISGATFSDNEIKITNYSEGSAYFWVITSDYLMNGGDNMKFFEKRTETIYLDALMRDVMLKFAEKSDTLVWKDDKRIHF